MYIPKIREVKEALTSFFSKPYTTKFPAGGYKPEEQFRGFPRYHNEDCVGCGTCAQVCPPGAITVTDDLALKTRTLTINFNSCIHCGQCQEHCITEEGVILSNQYSFSVMDKKDPSVFENIKKDVLLCEVCGALIAPSDQLRWIRERLGAKAPGAAACEAHDGRRHHSVHRPPCQCQGRRLELAWRQQKKAHAKCRELFDAFERRIPLP